MPASTLPGGGVFLVTVPVAAAAALGLSWLRTPTARPAGGIRLDGAGAAGAGLVAAFVMHEQRVADPLQPARLLASRRLVGACLGFGAYCAGYVAVVVVTSLLLQERYGLSPPRPGWCWCPCWWPAPSVRSWRRRSGADTAPGGSPWPR